MMTIWKFPFEVHDRVELAMPRGARVLSVQVQKSVPCIWALCDTDVPLETRRFVVFGTGHDASGVTAHQFVGTFQQLGGALIFHLFEA